MAGPWDALGRGIESGMQAFLTGKQRQEDVKTRAAAEAMERERLGLEKFRTQTAIDQYAQEQALAEQLRAEERHGRYDPRTDLTRGIFIPMYKEMGEGVRVPTSQAERDQIYTEGIAAWEAKEAGLAGEDHQRRLEEIEYAARMGHKYSYPPSHIAAEKRGEPSFFMGSEVNPTDAYAFLQNWIGRAGTSTIAFRADPRLQEAFLDDISLLYSATVPGAREKAKLWLLQLPPTEVSAVEPKTAMPPATVFGQAARVAEQAAPAVTSVAKAPWPVGFGPIPPLPTKEQIVSTGKGIVGLAENIAGKISGAVTQPAQDIAGKIRNLVAPQAATPQFTGRQAIEQRIRAANPNMPEPLIQQLIEEEYRKLMRQW